MSKKSVTQPGLPDAAADKPAPVVPAAPVAAAAGSSVGAKALKPVAPHLELTAENTGKPQPGKTFTDANGNVRTDH